MLTHLKTYNPRDNKYIEAKNNLVNNASNFYKGREKIIEGFKNKIFPIYYDEREKFRKEDEEEDEEDEEKKNKKKNKKNRKNKKKNKKNKKKKANLLNILKINQKILAEFRLVIILILQNLVIWLKNYLK